MLDRAFSIEEIVRAQIRNGPGSPTTAPGAVPGGASSTLQLPETETAFPGTGGALGGGGLTAGGAGGGGGGKPAIGGIYIVWKDLNADLWPSFLKAIPLALFVALNEAIGLMAAQAFMDGAVWWDIQPLIDRSAMVVASVMLVVPPFIVPLFDPPKGMPAISLTRYEENLELKGRLFMLGVPIDGRVTIHPRLTLGPSGGSTTPISSGRPMTSQSLLSAAGMQRAIDDFRHELHHLAPQLLSKSVETVIGALTTDLIAGAREVIAGALKTTGAAPYLDALAKEIKDLVIKVRDTAIDSTLAPVKALGLDPVRDALNEIVTEVFSPATADKLTGKISDKFKDLDDKIRTKLDEAAAKWKTKILNAFYDNVFSLSTLGIMSNVQKATTNSNTFQIKNAEIDDGFGRKMQPGWWVRIGQSITAQVTGVRQTNGPGSPWEITVDKNVTIPDDAQMFAFPEPWNKEDSLLDLWMALNKGAERASNYAGGKMFDAIVGDKLKKWENDLSQHDPKYLQAGTQQTLAQIVSDFGAQQLGKKDFEDLDKGKTRDVIRPIQVTAGDALAVTGAIARWIFANGAFVADDKGRSLHVHGAANGLNDGDWVIDTVVDDHTVKTQAGSLGDEHFDPATVAVQVAIPHKEDVNWFQKQAAALVKSAGDFVQKALEKQFKSWAEDFVANATKRKLTLNDYDILASSAGGHSLSDIFRNSTTSVANDFSNIIKAGNILDFGGDIQRLKDQLQNATSKAATDLNRQTLNIANGAVRELFARLFIFTCVVGFELQDGIEVEGGGLLADWSSNIFIDNRIHRCTAHTDQGSGGNGGGIMLKGPLPNIFLVNDIDQNEAEERGGGFHCDDAAWPILVFNDVTRNSAHAGGGLDFARSSLPIAIFNTIKNNRAVGNPSGIGGGIRAACFEGFLLFNELKGNSATMYGGGLYIDGDGYLAFNDIIGNSADRLGGGVYANGGGEFSLNDIARNRAPMGGGVAVVDGTTDLGANNVAGNLATTAGGGYAIIGARARPRVSDEISGNAAAIGGGVYVEPLSNPDLGGSDILHNTASADGGGVYLDAGPASPPFRGVTAVNCSANACGGRGGGLFTIRDATVVASSFVGNTAVAEGGGLCAVGLGDLTLAANYLFANMAPKGGGVSIRSTSFIASQDNQFRFNLALSGEGGGLLVEFGERLTLERDFFARNATHGANGGGACVRDLRRVAITGASLQENTTYLENDPIRLPLSSGGGVYLERVDSVDVRAARGLLNASELGGAVGIRDCTTSSIVSSEFLSNYADQDRDGLGMGGAIFATGAATRVNIGGGADREGNHFLSNAAGTPGAERVAAAAPDNAGHGGAIAIVDGPVAIVEGNVFEHNAATHDGGAVYLRDTAAGSRLGGDNDDLPPVLGARRFGNLFIDNCEVERIHEYREPCCTQTQRPPTTFRVPLIDLDIPLQPEDEITGPDAPPPAAPPSEMTRERGRDVSTDVPTDIPTDVPTHTPTDTPTNVPRRPPCDPWVVYEDLVFRKAPFPARPRLRRRIDWLKPLQSRINQAIDQLPPDKLILLALVAPGIQLDFTLYSLWPAESDQRGRYDVGTPTSAFLPGWAPRSDWRAVNVGRSGGGFTGGNVTVRDDVLSRPLPPVVTRRGGAFAVIRGDGTSILGNFLDRNYAVQFGGAGLVEGSDRRTILGAPSGEARFGRNDFIANVATFGGALALVGATRARVVWNRIGVGSEFANFATGGGGIFILNAAPEIGGTPSETTEVLDNVAGHHIGLADGGLAPPLLRQLHDAGLVAFGGGIAALGSAGGEGAVIRFVPIERNAIVRPDRAVAAAATVPTGASTITLGDAPPGAYFVGGGVAALFDAKVRLSDCRVRANDVAPLSFDASTPMVCLAGGGIAVGFDRKPVVNAKTLFATAPSRPATAGTTLRRVDVRANLVRMPQKGMNAAEHELLGGGVALLEANRPRLEELFVADNQVFRQREAAHQPFTARLRLAGGGVAARNSNESSIVHARVERNRLFDLDSPKQAIGGGLAMIEGSLAIAQSWFVNNFSYRDGGGLAIVGSPTTSARPARLLGENVTIADNDALARGPALFADGDLAGSRIDTSILDAYGSWDAYPAVGGKDLTEPHLVRHCCVWAPTLRGATILGGTLREDPAARNFSADPGYDAPRRRPEADYSVRAGSPCHPAAGQPVGYQRRHSTRPYEARRLSVPSLAYPNIASALAAARRGDVIDVAPGRYAEILSVPAGVVLRATAGPLQTFLELPAMPPQQHVPALVTLQASDRRSAFCGFTVVGKDTVPIDPTQPPWLGVVADVAVSADTHYDGYISGNALYWWKTGVRATAPAAYTSEHPCWISGNTAVLCRNIGIHISGSQHGGHVPPRKDPCRVPKPEAFAPAYPPMMPTVEHNISIGHLGSGLIVDAADRLAATRVAFNEFFDNQADISGLLDQAIVMNDNEHADPKVVDLKVHHDFRLEGSPSLSLARAVNAKDQRYRGAFDEA